MLRSSARCSHHNFAGGAGCDILPGLIVGLIVGFQKAASAVVFNHCLDSQLIRFAFHLIQDEREIAIRVLMNFLYPRFEHAGFRVTGGPVRVIPEMLAG